MSGTLTVIESGRLAAEAARRISVAAADAVATRGRFVLALAGGSTPRTLYGALAEGAGGPVPWAATTILFGDERAVAPGHPHSNYGMARETLLSRVPLDPDRIHRMEGEADLEEAADRYERVLTRLFPGEPLPRIDLVLLGLGADGHTASLFPGSPALEETVRWVVPVDLPGKERRLTLTLPVLNAAHRVLFLVAGAEKARALARAFGPEPDLSLPAALIRPMGGTLEVLADREAAGA